MISTYETGKHTKFSMNNYFIKALILFVMIGYNGVICIDRNLKKDQQNIREKNQNTNYGQIESDVWVEGKSGQRGGLKQLQRSTNIQTAIFNKQNIGDKQQSQEEIQINSNSQSNKKQANTAQILDQYKINQQLQKRAKKIKVSGFKQSLTEKTKVAAAVVVNSNIPVYTPAYPIYTQPTYPYPYPYTAYPYATTPYPAYNPYQTYYPYQYPTVAPTNPYVYPQYYQQPVYQQPVYQQPVYQPVVYQQPQPVVVQQPQQPQQQPQQQQSSAALPQDSLTNLVSNLLKTSTTTVSSSGGVTNINITPASTPQALSSQLTNNIINNVFTHLIPKTDPSFYNTGPSEKVYQLKNISLNTGSTAAGSSSNSNTNTNTVNSNNLITNPPTNISKLAISGTQNGVTTSGAATGTNSGTITTGTINSGATNPSNTNTNTASNIVPPQSLIPTGGTPISLQTGVRSLSTPPSLQTSPTDQVKGTATPKTATLVDTVLPNTTVVPNPAAAATTKAPVVNGTITGTVVTQGQPVSSGTQLKYEEFLLKFKPNLLTNNPSQVSVYRQTIFNLNVNTIDQINSSPNSSYKVGVNLFADLSKDEFNQNFAKLFVPDTIRNQAQLDINKLRAQGKNILTVPPSINIDWSCKASPVITQGVCGACFTIAALQAIQITMRMYNRTADSLSVQEVISCGGNNFDNNGCNGGYFSAVFSYAEKLGVGQSPIYFYDDKAKYQGVLSDCNTTIVKSRAYDKNRVFIKSSTLIRFGDCAQIVNQLKFRSVAVAIAAYGFQFYVGGTYSTTEKYINHGVTLVGYDANQGYLIKNTWGGSWGKFGYGFVDQTTGVCDYGMYPVLIDQSGTPTPCNANGESIDIEKLATPSTNQIKVP